MWQNRAYDFAIALGGHWKRLNKIIGGTEPAGWMSMEIDRPEFHRNRVEVVSRCIERGINYVDACSARKSWPTVEL